MKKLTPFLIPLSLLVIALSIFSLGYESKMGSESMMGATTKIKLTDPNSVTPAATSTPTADMIPIAESNGKINDGFFNLYTQAVSSPTTSRLTSLGNSGSCSNGCIAKQIRIPYNGFYAISYSGTCGDSYSCSMTLKKNDFETVNTTAIGRYGGASYSTTTVYFLAGDYITLRVSDQFTILSNFIVDWGLIRTSTLGYNGNVSL